MQSKGKGMFHRSSTIFLILAISGFLPTAGAAQSTQDQPTQERAVTTTDALEATTKREASDRRSTGDMPPATPGKREQGEVLPVDDDLAQRVHNRLAWRLETRLDSRLSWDSYRPVENVAQIKRSDKSLSRSTSNTERQD